MTPEQTILAEQIVSYALDKLRTVELQHQHDPREIIGEILRQLVAAECEVQKAKAESATTERLLFDLIGATWGDSQPPGNSHALTLERATFLREFAKQAADANASPEESPHFAGALEGAENERPEGP